MDFNTLLEQLSGLVQKLTKKQKWIIGISTISVVAFIVFLIIYTNTKSSNDGYAILFDNISPKDAALVIDQLEKDNVPYKIVNDSTIKVPKDVVYKERITIASKGIPKSSKIGFELFDKQEFGETDFSQKIKYLRALEGELSRTVESLVPIKDAKVHIALPKESLFVEKEQKPTASVVVTLQPYMKLTYKQIIGIKNLVAASVPKLKSEDVKIIDENGNPLDIEDLGGYDNELVKAQIKYKKDFEKNYEKKIVNVLAPILGGKDRVVAKVNIDFDFKQKREKSEYYDPENVVRSEKSVEEKRIGFAKKDTSGVPGAISNIGPIQPNQAQKQTEKYEKSSTTTNYEVSKKITDIKGEFAQIKRVSVAVVVDGKYNLKKDKDNKEKVIYQPLSKEELEKLTTIVKNTIGFNKNRGDSVTVSNFELNPNQPKIRQETEFQKIMKNYINPAMPFIKYLLAALILFIFYKKVIVPFTTKMLETYEEIPEEVPEEEEEILTEEDKSSLEKYNEMKKRVEEELGLSETLDKEEIKYDILLDKLRKDIENSPEDIARVIKSILDEQDKGE